MAQFHRTTPQTVAFVGFGEAATAFLTGWGTDRPRNVTAYDIKTEQPRLRTQMTDKYREHNVTGCDMAKDALGSAEIVFSVVTADQAFEAAASASDNLAHGVLWFDCNSCAPDTKRRAAGVIDRAGGRYVDVAVMAPVYPKLHKAPLLISGPHVADAMETLSSLQMCPTKAGDLVGHASAIKMLRSVMIKGLEALMAECFLSARKAGVETEVIASLEASDPDIDWRVRGGYNLERMMAHGARRAAEMREAAQTVADLGLPNAMSAATAIWQDEIAGKGIAPGKYDLVARLDALLAAR